MKFLCGLTLGAIISWAACADHYGMILTSSSFSGIFCRIYGYDTVLRGSLFDRTSLCVDLTYAIPEQDLQDDYEQRLFKVWSYPQ